MKTNTEYLISTVGRLLSTYRFHMTDITDDNDRCVAYKNRVELYQLQRAYDTVLSEKDHKQQPKSQAGSASAC